VRAWKVIDWGAVETPTADVEITCPGCGKDSSMPVYGRPVAVLRGTAIVFDLGRYAIPASARCPHCKRVIEAT
jgi:hypothetical protein